MILLGLFIKVKLESEMHRLMILTIKKNRIMFEVGIQRQIMKLKNSPYKYSQPEHPCSLWIPLCLFGLDYFRAI